MNKTAMQAIAIAMVMAMAATSLVQRGSTSTAKRKTSLPSMWM